MKTKKKVNGEVSVVEDKSSSTNTKWLEVATDWTLIELVDYGYPGQHGFVHNAEFSPLNEPVREGIRAVEAAIRAKGLNHWLSALNDFKQQLALVV